MILNDAVQRKEFACFDINKIQDNLQKRRQGIRNQKQLMIQRVLDREEEIAKEVKNVCLQTTEKIVEVATNSESQILKDEDKLKSLMNQKLFRKETDEDCIQSVYFYNELKILSSTYDEKRLREEVSFEFMTQHVLKEKIVELVGCINFGKIMLDETHNNITCMKNVLQDGDNIEALVLGSLGEVFLLSGNCVYRVF